MRIMLAAALAVPFVAPAWAQETKPFYGGQIAVVGGVGVETIVRDGALKAWVRDHDGKSVTVSGRAALVVGDRKVDVPVRMDGEALVVEAPVKAADKVSAVLSLAVEGKAVSVHFSQDAVVEPTLGGRASAGARVFAEVCAVCHGAVLRGTDNGPPLLHPNYAPSGTHGDEIILSAVRNGAKAHHWKFGDMPKPEGAKPGQERDLLAYIRAMQAANGIVAAVGGDHKMH